MTYEKLAEIIEAMSPEQRKMEVVYSYAGENVVASLVTQVAFAEADEGDEPFPLGQTIIS